jgi:exopolyphosphatase/guanosine-5'-triphosphate,3'-diphosphate pyrophosphatase
VTQPPHGAPPGADVLPDRTSHEIETGPTAASARTLRIAAVDIGSNSIRMIVADVSPAGEIRVVDEMKAMPRLGVGVDGTGMLADVSMDAAAAALARMATLARQMHADRVDAVATSAVRDAANGGAFLDRVRAETGLAVRVLSGEEEARLSFRSALAHFELANGRTVVMDIGGGSLELALAAEGLLDRLVSLPFGAIRATEQFLAGAADGGRGHGATTRALRELRRAVRWAVRDELPVREWRGARVIGSGGTFTNLAGVVAARSARTGARSGSAKTPGPRSRHGTVVSRAEVEHVLDRLAAMTSAERAAVPGLNPARADIIVAGLATAAEVLAVFEARDLHVSGYGIREGLLLEAASVAPTPADPGEARARSVRAFAERCRYERPHAEQVRRLALHLFDQLAGRLGATPGDREVLADAALLHDVGYHINYERHHKHSYHLIQHADLLGVTPAEQEVIAQIARYHRGKLPTRRHPAFAALDRAGRRRVRRLAAVLRVADGLDRGHAAAVGDVRVDWNTGQCRIVTTPAEGADTLRLDVWGAERKSDLLARLLGVDVEIVEVGAVRAGVTGEASGGAALDGDDERAH